MPKKPSKGGTSSAKVVPIRPSADSNSQDSNTLKSAVPSTVVPETPSTEMKPYFGKWTSDTGRQLTSQPTALEVWMVTQATSILKRRCTFEEAVELFQTIDITSRQPKDAAAAPPSSFARALRALRAFCGTILLGMGISG